MAKSIYSLQSELLRGEIVNLRKEAGFTQRDLAKRLNREQNYVARLEVGERRLDLIEFFSLCRACNANPSKTADRLFKKFVENAPDGKASA